MQGFETGRVPPPSHNADRPIGAWGGDLVEVDASTRDRIRAYLRTTRGKKAIDREVKQLRSFGKVEILKPL